MEMNDKCLKVINSCETRFQLLVALKYVSLARIGGFITSFDFHYLNDLMMTKSANPGWGI